MKGIICNITFGSRKSIFNLDKKLLGEDIPLAAKGFYDIDFLKKHNLLNQQIKLKVYNLNRGLV